MLIRLLILGGILFAIILVVGFVFKLIRIAISLAVIVGIVAVVFHLLKKKA